MEKKNCVACGGRLVEASTSQQTSSGLILASQPEKKTNTTDFKCESCGLKYDLPTMTRQILKD